MKASKTHRRKSPSRDRLVIAVCLLFLGLAMAPLLSPSVFHRIFGPDPGEPSSSAVAEVIWSKNDIRMKSSQSGTWRKVDGHELARPGDRLFTGNHSQARVQINEGGILDVGADSMIVFNEDQTVDLESGNFRLALMGSQRIRVQGKLIELQAQNSEVQFLIKKGEVSRLQVLKGSVTLTKSDGSRSALGAGLLDLETPRKPSAEDLPQVQLPPYFHRFDEWTDFYETEGEVLRFRPERLSRVAFHLEVKTGGGSSLQVAQLAGTADFSEAQMSRRNEDSTIVFDRVDLGKNYIRFSEDGLVWGPEKDFLLLTEPLEMTAPTLAPFPPNPVKMGRERTSIKVSFENSAFERNLLEVSSTPDFKAVSTFAVWVPPEGLNWEFRENETLYLRARGVNSRNQITAYGPTSRLDIVREVDGAPPLLSRNSPQILQEKSPVDVPEQQVIAETSPEPPRLEGGETPQPSEDPVNTYLNRHHGDSKIAIEGSAFTIFSQRQVDQGIDSPTALTGGIRLMHWWGAHGFEGVVKTKITNIKVSADGGVSPLQAEARYHYRFGLEFNPFSRLRRSQISLFGGYEFYRNSASGPFSPGYGLMKVGTSMTFPFISHWDTGGELVYGRGFDQSLKYEISGFFNYYLDPRWSIGLGYRAHLFSAGSVGSSPGQLPYREAFGEGYSVLRWSY